MCQRIRPGDGPLCSLFVLVSNGHFSLPRQGKSKHRHKLLRAEYGQVMMISIERAPVAFDGAAFSAAEHVPWPEHSHTFQNSHRPIDKVLPRLKCRACRSDVGLRAIETDASKRL